jgi:ethanolamine utilization microcompartment shell protein EutL
MCYSSVSAASKDGQKAIGKAVAVLVAPPLGVMTLGVGLAFRYGRKRDQEKNLDDHSLPR